MTAQLIGEVDHATVRIESDRLLQRPVEKRDLGDLLDVNNDDEVTRFLPYETWNAIEDAQAWYERISRLQAEGRARQFVIVEKASGKVIGASVIFNVDEASERAEVGYVLGKAYWGSGRMREALAALLDYAFDTLKMRRVEAYADARNSASDRLLRRLGFTCEGTLRQRSVIKGEVRDSAAYGLLRGEWTPSG